jgi:hypothetical protein
LKQEAMRRKRGLCSDRMERQGPIASLICMPSCSTATAALLTGPPACSAPQSQTQPLGAKFKFLDLPASCAGSSRRRRAILSGWLRPTSAKTDTMLRTCRLAAKRCRCNRCDSETPGSAAYCLERHIPYCDRCSAGCLSSTGLMPRLRPHGTRQSGRPLCRASKRTCALPSPLPRHRQHGPMSP